MKYLIVCMAFLLSMSSCSTSDDGGENTGQEVKVTFSLKVEQSVSTVVKTRSSSYTDSSIRCIDLLVFDENKRFLQRIAVNNIEGSQSAPTFSVRLPASSTSRTIHVIANGRNEANADVINFNAIASGMTEDAVASSLQTSSLSPYTSPELPLVMWGKTLLSGIAPGTVTGTIPLIRQVASMRMECAAGTSVNGMDKFTLKGFSLQQSAALGKVIPNSHDSSDAVPTSVSVFSTTLYVDYINPDGSGIWYTATGNATSDAYLYERSNVLDNTGLSVIVHGEYDGTDGYYKIWVKNDGGVVDPVRNHRYIIQITRVSGPGYLTLEEALHADYSANIYTDIIDNNNDITDIIVDGKYELGISSNEVRFDSEGVQTIGTVLSTNTSAQVTVSADVEWITDLTLAISASDNTRYTLTGTLDSTETTRSGKVSIRAGSLTRTITVTQQIPIYN